MFAFVNVPCACAALLTRFAFRNWQQTTAVFSRHKTLCAEGMEIRNEKKLNSGYLMPIIGLGSWQADDEDTVRRAIDAAFQVGYRHIDTAWNYNNEAVLGKVLREFFESGKIKREDIFITTKLPMNGMHPSNVRDFFDASIKALQIDYLDMYLIHFPLATKRTENDRENFPIAEDGDLDVDNTVDFLDTWKAMEKLVEQGLVRSIGLSNFNRRQIKRICDEGRIRPSNLQVECHAYLPQFELEYFCKEMDIVFTAYSPLGSPGLAEFAFKNFGVEVNLDILLNDERLKPIASSHNKTPAQVLLRYLVERGMVVIPKSTNPKRIAENMNIFDFALHENDITIIKSMAKNYRYFPFNHLKRLAEHPEQPFNEPY